MCLCVYAIVLFFTLKVADPVVANILLVNVLMSTKTRQLFDPGNNCQTCITCGAME